MQTNAQMKELQYYMHIPFNEKNFRYVIKKYDLNMTVFNFKLQKVTEITFKRLSKLKMSNTYS